MPSTVFWGSGRRMPRDIVIAGFEKQPEIEGACREMA